MKALQPVVFIWTGEVMVPQAPSLPLCMRQFSKGEAYRMNAEQERSVASHRHFFAVLNEAWHNLPEHLAAAFPTPKRLRTYCLAKCYFASEQKVTYQTIDDAEKTCELLKAKDEDSYAQVDGNVLTIWTPYSQSYASMNKQQFEETKQAVLDLLSDMLGVSVTELNKNAGKAA